MNGIVFGILQFAVILFSLSVHESAHAWMAEKFGDPTGRREGRITLNPIPHIDLIGTIILPLILYFTKSPIFGWAKPVMVNPMNLRNPRRDHMYIAAAGPVSNLIIGVGSTILFLIFKQIHIPALMSIQIGVMTVLYVLVHINILLAVFNLIPIAPLDGGWILEGMLKGEALQTYYKIKPYGFMILLLLFYTNIFKFIVEPVFALIRAIGVCK